MKNNIILVLCLINFSCSKIIDTEKNVFITSKIKAFLLTNLSKNDYESIDFEKISVIKILDENTIVSLPVMPMNEKRVTLFLNLNLQNEVIDVKKVLLDTNTSKYTEGNEGEIIIMTLKDELYSKYKIINGLIVQTTFSKSGIKTTLNSKTIQDESEEDFYAPPVVVTSYINGSNIQFVCWLSLNFLNYSNSSNSYIMQPVHGGGGAGSSGMLANELLNIDFVDIQKKEAIDPSDYINCFNNIENNGAEYSITISSDLPIDNHPELPIFNPQGSPGHVFLTFTKKRGSSEITQSFGFYPNRFGLSNVGSKIVNDGDHEVNAEYLISIDNNAFNKALNKLIMLSKLNYNFIDYNCTNFALDIFNSFGNNLNISAINSTNLLWTSMKNTPSSVYAAIKDVSIRGNPNAKFYNTKKFAKASTGPCN